jgi:hypothetical protein
MPYPAPTDFETLSGTLRLSHKYCVDYIRDRALVHLSSNYFTKLSALDESCTPKASSWKKPSWSAPTFSVKVAAIELAREVEAFWTLPFAFYSLATGDNPILRLSSRRIYRDRHSSLSEADELAFLEGCCVQRDSATSDLMRFLHYPAQIPGCWQGHRCTSARLRAIEEVWKDRKGAFEGDPLYLWFGTDWDRLLDARPTCIMSMKLTHQHARQTFWDQLPALYRLPEWGHLERLKEGAIGLEES